VDVAQKVTLKLSAEAAAYVRPETAREVRLSAARGDVSLKVADLGMVLFLLSRDPDPEVRGAAVRSLRELPDSILIPLAAAADTHPLLLDALARVHHENAALVGTILAHQDLDERTRQFLAVKETTVSPVGNGEAGRSDAGPEDIPEDEQAGAEIADLPSAEEDEEETVKEEYLSKYKLLLSMPINEKIRMAMIGDKEWRSLLIKETNKLVSSAVIKNPRITEPEILAIAKSSELNEEVIRLVSMNREWIKVYPIRKALVENSKTPLPKALRFLSTMNEKDMLAMAKSKNISSVIARQAQRLLLNKKKSS
jgi:hypothetical protein